MANGPSKKLVLLEAYAELARKESFCVKEANLEPLAKLQAKKSALLEGLQQLAATPTDPDESDTIQHLLAETRELEAESARGLEVLMKENRAELRKLSQSAKSASSVLKAYNAPANAASPKSNLKGRV